MPVLQPGKNIIDLTLVFDANETVILLLNITLIYVIKSPGCFDHNFDTDKENNTSHSIEKKIDTLIASKACFGGNSQKQLPEATPRGNSQRHLPEAPPRGTSQRYLPEAPPRGTSQRQLPEAPPRA
ncbi:hypothetical protein L228DRAFT_270499 [Xylona heveae TC161]|uniref:Uncharacterized protein n=1 Tax=Xylona heveae (strain CBS 132557 / TC161) TaxID=1328760 RepID=A0A165AGB1_XYLHT|nr:hypothetical protein L228DRAFT_270499 [Xylona heveae TC161]KZF20428.1 hypothetical protein L228DRAFT_270499 [Xylona heveae TC161]